MLRVCVTALDLDMPTLNLEPSLGEETDRFRVDAVFLFEDTTPQCLTGISGQERDHGLNNNGTRIGPLINEMDRATGKTDPVIRCLLLNVDAWEGREQCRMNVHNPSGKRGDKFRRNDTHVAGKHHKVHVVLF